MVECMYILVKLSFVLYKLFSLIQLRTVLSFTNAAKPSVVFIQSTLMVQVPLMSIVTKLQLVEDGQWSRKGWMALLISTAPGRSTKRDLVISSFANFGWDWTRSNAWRKTRQKTNFAWIWEYMPAKLFTLSTNGLVLRMRQLITSYASVIFHVSQSIHP